MTQPGSRCFGRSLMLLSLGYAFFAVPGGIVFPAVESRDEKRQQSRKRYQNNQQLQLAETSKHEHGDHAQRPSSEFIKISHGFSLLVITVLHFSRMSSLRRVGSPAVLFQGTEE